ncbi:MAG: adenine phosphoribosyltransferase [Halobacteriovoraceae bacterium]|nr:adenine phosphoribosyltransferase [Halobacteriovoraceae bacterium]
MNLKELIRTVPDFPHKGIMFRDITTLLKNSDGFHYCIDEFCNRYEHYDFDLIAAIESRGFILGAAMAYRLNKGLVLVRKKGKLPGETVSQEYQLEYGTDVLEMHTDSIKKGQKVLLVDDLLATGGTAMGAKNLIEKLGGTVCEFAAVIDLPELKGKEKLEKSGLNVFNLIDFEGL